VSLTATLVSPIFPFASFEEQEAFPISSSDAGMSASADSLQNSFSPGETHPTAARPPHVGGSL